MTITPMRSRCCWPAAESSPVRSIGKTDDLGMKVVEDKVHIHDLHATILHCLGLNHLQLTYRHQGRNFRLTDVAGEVVQKMLS